MRIPANVYVTSELYGDYPRTITETPDQKLTSYIKQPGPGVRACAGRGAAQVKCIATKCVTKTPW